MLRRAFAHPASRVALLAATVAATVATSPPEWDWTLEDEVPAQHITLQPGESVERRIRFERRGEADGGAGTVEVGAAGKKGTLDVVFDDLRTPEVPPAGRYNGDGSGWLRMPTVAGEKPWPTSRIGFNVNPDAAAPADVAVKVTNAGSTSIEVTLAARISTGGYGDQPADAFVNVEILP